MKQKKKIMIISLIIIVVIVTSLGVIREIIMKGKELKVNNSKEYSKFYYKNPIGGIKDIGDPFVLKALDKKYYYYPTTGGNGFRAWESNDLVKTNEIGTVMQGVGSWAFKDFWAPEVVVYKGKYYMYYTARWSQNNSLRVGVAVSDSPKGPFKDVLDKPLFDFGYAVIDANVLIDEDNKKYLFFSRDCSENLVGARHESHIYGIELNDDMISVKGEPVLLSKPEQSWEKNSTNGFYWNEGPTVIKNNGIYYLMYSANYYASKLYSIGYATSKNPLGKYTKYENNPIVSAQPNWNNVSGLGHNSVTTSPDGKEMFMVYHTHTDPKNGGGDRQIFIDRMGFREDGSIYVNAPTVTEQPMPSGTNADANIASEAKITTSPTKAGYKEKAITDGEIGIYEKFGKNEWVPSKGKEDVWVKLEWDKEKQVNSVLVYGSALNERALASVKLEFSNGKIVSSLAFSKQPGSVAIANFADMNVKWVKVIIDKSKIIGSESGLSEIMVYSKIK